MRTWLLAAWLIALLLALAGGWVIWTHPLVLAQLPREDLRIAAAAVPLVIWGLLPVFLGGAFRSRPAVEAPPKLRDQRRAILALLNERGLGGKRSRYALPVYVVLGTAGSGKSGLLERSTLGFGRPVEIGAWTWWVSDEAICVEAKVSQSGQEASDLFATLRWLRPQLPVNGAILVLSPADLTLADRQEHRDTAQSFALALRDLEKWVGHKVPTYLLLSKVDLIPGFLEFFDRQDPQERAQPWGFSLPLRPLDSPISRAESAEVITGGFRSLVDSMRTRLVEWLSREADPVRCGRIQSFGAQVANLQQIVQPMLDALQPESTRGWSGAPLRGVFLTSARQEALSIDALLPELSSRFAMPRSGTLPPDLGMNEEENGYFISGAFRQAIYPEAGLVDREHGRRWAFGLQWAVSLAIVALCAGLAYLLLPIFDSQVGWPTYVHESVDGETRLTSPSPQSAVSEIVNRIDRFAEIRQALGGEKPVPSFAVGLDAARPLAGTVAAGRDALLRNGLVPHLKSMIETELADLDAEIPELRRLLAIAEPPGSADPEALKAWLEKAAGQLPEPARAAFVSDALVAIRAAGGLAVDPRYIEAAKRIIAYKESLT